MKQDEKDRAFGKEGRTLKRADASSELILGRGHYKDFTNEHKEASVIANKEYKKGDFGFIPKMQACACPVGTVDTKKKRREKRKEPNRGAKKG